MSDELRSPAPPVTAGAKPQPQQISVDSSEISTAYTNFCRVNVTPEELVLDFGLNTTITPNPNQPVKVSHRVVMNFYTAKRLLGALMGVIQQHEAAFGPLELDFQKRMQGSKPAGSPASPYKL